jgi:hypothetical protein
MPNDDKREVPIETGGENAGASPDLDLAVTGAKDADPRKGTSKIGGDDQVPEQTQTPASDNDAGVPEDIPGRTD